MHLLSNCGGSVSGSFGRISPSRFAAIPAAAIAYGSRTERCARIPPTIGESMDEIGQIFAALSLF